MNPYITWHDVSDFSSMIISGPQSMLMVNIRASYGSRPICCCVLLIQLLCSRGPGSIIDIATGYGLDGPGIESRRGARVSAPVQNGPGAHPASCTMSTGFFPGVKSGRSVTLTPYPLLVPWSWKSRAIPLLALWAVRPVQSLSACTRVHFTFTLLCSHCLLYSVYFIHI
jgi:hypothetical protein